MSEQSAIDLLDIIFDRDCRYEDGDLVIPCGSHGAALALAIAARRLISNRNAAVAEASERGFLPEGADTANDGYTIDEIDDAIRAIGGDHTVRRGEFGWSRPLAMNDAAARAWMDQRPEDRHSRVLRAALRDMSQTGAMQPKGDWPDDA